MKRKALILGVTGQDGALLARQLLDAGMEVYGGFRRGTSNLWRLEDLGILDNIKLVEFQLLEVRGLFPILTEAKFDHIYHLAGDGFVSDSFHHPSLYFQTHTLSVLDLMEVVRVASPTSRVFYASSSEIFGPATGSTTLHVDETAEPNPVSPYAVAKLAGQNLAKVYRDRWGLHVSSGILFNHESALRSQQFVTRKVTSNIARLAQHGGLPIRLGDMSSKKDWSAAQDIVSGMSLMLESDKPLDYVLGSGETHSVEDVLRISAQVAGFEPVFEGEGLGRICFDKSSGNRIAVSSKDYYRAYPQLAFTANTARAQADLGWVRQVTFQGMIERMTEKDLEIVKRRHKDA